MDLIYVETTVIGNVARRIHSNPVRVPPTDDKILVDTAAAQYELAIRSLSLMNAAMAIRQPLRNVWTSSMT